MNASADAVRLRLARLRARVSQERSVPDVRLWWDALTGDPLDLDEREDVVLRAASMLGILPSFELDWMAEPPDLRWEWEGSFERGGAPELVLERAGRIGSDPYLVVAEVTAVGLLSCRGHRPEALSTLLLDRTQHGDLWALIARDLSRALVVNWDDESLTDDGLCWLQARWVEPSARSAGSGRDRNGT